jgi:hypothetical protein
VSNGHTMIMQPFASKMNGVPGLYCLFKAYVLIALGPPLKHALDVCGGV